MKKFRKALALMLALCMVIGLVPASLAADDSDGSGAVDGYLYNIVHVDCGRKYFSPESLKKIIDNAAAAGFNQVELYLSDNQGFRFALDDMSVTTTYGTYDLTPALGDGYSDGSKYPDYSGKYLTQSEMTDIIAYAKTKGIDIVPCINVPGHMGAILEEFSSFRYTKNSSISKSSIDLNSDEAVAFALGITEKYAEYFAGQGCNFYNIGADEYANDLSSMGFEGMGQTMYNKFVAFMNDAADIIIAAGMTPRAFNDGFYYKDYTSGQINSEYEVCYWTSGWGGYDVATAETIASKGHKLINTHGDYYWVLGNSGWQCSATKASGFKYTSFQGGTISNPAGSMFCIWCDVGNADGQDGGTAVVSDTADVIAAFGAALPAVAPTVNASNIVTLESNGVFVTAPDLTGLSAETTTAPAIDGANNVKAWNIVPSTAEGSYTASASVRVPVPSGWNTSNMGAFVVNPNGSVSLIKGTYAEGYYTYTAPHFSVTGVYDVEAADIDAEDTVSQDGTEDVYELDTNGLDSGSQYLIVYRDSTSSSTGLALNTSKGSTNVTISGNNATPSGDAGSALWTYTTGSNSRKYLSNGSSYLYPSRDWFFGYYYSLNIDSSKTAVSISNSGSGLYYIGNSSKNSFVQYSNSDGWDAGSSSQNFYFYKYTPGTATYTVDPALQRARIDALDDVVNDGYTDESWTAYENALTAAQDKLTEVSGATYNSQAEADDALAELTALVDALATAKNNLKKARTITVEYIADGVAVKTETLKVAVDAASVTLSSPFTVDGMIYSVADTTLVLTDAATYTVNVTAVEEDLSTVDPLKVEYWITNRHVTAGGAESIEISAEDAYGKNGVLIKNLVPAEGTIESNTAVYWKSTRLASDNKQTEASGVDKTSSGTDFAYIRYWNGSWAYSADGAQWTNVASGDQIVAYYLQFVQVTDEIDSLVVDWGVVPSTSYNSENFVLLDYAVKYESGEMVPDSFPVGGKTQAFHCDPTDTNTVHQYNGGSSSTWYNNYREISMIYARETAEYEVYMITVTPTSDSRTTQVASNANKATSYTYGGTEKVIWVDDEANLGEFADESRHYTSISGEIAYSVGGEAIVPGLEIFNRHGMLVTYYVRAKVTTDSLSVHYVDITDGVGSLEFYAYNIAVNQNTVFNENIKLDKTITTGNRVINGAVVNSLGKTQTVSSDLSTLPALSAQYRYSEYECVDLVRSEDGKDVYLYYKFNSVVMFVADFGLPIEIKASDLNADLTDESINSIAYSGSAATKFGSLAVSGKTIVYTPNKVFTGLDSFTVTVRTGANETDQISYRVHIVPATTVYYEEGFAEYSGSGWDGGASLGTGTQTTSPAGSGDYYGFDAKYAAEAAGPSNKTEATSTMINDEATFTFSGTGVDIYANCREDSGIMVVLLYAVNGDGTESLRKYYRVDTHTEAGASGVTSGQAVESYNLPVVSVSGLDYGSYKVVVRHGGYYADGNTVVKDIMFDGFRVFNTMNNAADSTVYAADNEASPNFDEIRDHVLNALGVGDISDSESYTQEELASAAGQIYDSTTGSGIVILSENCSIGTGINVRDLLDNGPKNELFLRKGETLTFKLANGINNIQIGLKAVSAAVEVEINGEAQTVASSTDMFYELGDVAGQVITVTNNGEGILSVTDLKYFGTPSAEGEASGYSLFSRMSRANFMTAFSLMGMRSVSGDPSDTTADGAEDGSGSVSEPPVSSSDTTVPADSSDVTTSAPDASDVTTSAPDTSDVTTSAPDTSGENGSEPSGSDETKSDPAPDDETTSEPPADGEETNSSSGNADNSGEDSGDPFTGSRNDILIWSVIALVSSVAAVAAIIMVKKKIL